MIEIHVTDSRTFRECRWRWDWSNKYERTEQVGALAFGRAMHKAWAEYYRLLIETTASRAAATTHATDALKECGLNEKDYNLAEGMLLHYGVCAQDDDFVPIAVEQTFSVPLLLNVLDDNSVWLCGKWDAVVLDKATRKKLYVVEHKTASEPAIEMYDNDEQVIAYAIAANALYPNFTGVLVNVARKAVPARPTLRKDGVLPNYVPDTTYHDLLSYMEENSLDPAWEHHATILETLRQRGNTFFQRRLVFPSRWQKEIVQNTLVDVARDMVDATLYPSPSPLRCKMCDFQQPCLEQRSGGDYMALFADKYTRKE